MLSCNQNMTRKFHKKYKSYHSPSMINKVVVQNIWDGMSLVSSLERNNCDVTWATRRLKSPTTRLFVQQKTNVRYLINVPGSTRSGWRQRKHQSSELQALCEGTNTAEISSFEGRIFIIGCSGSCHFGNFQLVQPVLKISSKWHHFRKGSVMRKAMSWRHHASFAGRTMACNGDEEVWKDEASGDVILPRNRGLYTKDGGCKGSGDGVALDHETEVLLSRVENVENVNKDVSTSAREGPLRCSICGLRFEYACRLKRHVRYHTGEKPYICTVCGKDFRLKHHLDRHLRIHSGEKPYECAVCGKQFRHLQARNMHLRIHNGKNPYGCRVCGTQFSCAENLNKHNCVPRIEKPYQCTICGKWYAQLQSLSVHHRIHTGVKPYQCDICGRQFTQSGSLERHGYIHDKVTPYQCSVCGKQFSSVGGLARHCRIHPGKQPYQCSMCGERFCQASGLAKHGREHNEETIGEPYQCSVCNKRFASERELSSHSAFHLPAQPYECSVCRQKFAEMDDLKTHRLLHNREKPCKCSACGKGFTNENNLRNHLRSHILEETLHQCSVCKKQFSENFTMVRHMRIHTREQSYECANCGRRFSQKNNLARHLHNHADSTVLMHRVWKLFSQNLYQACINRGYHGANFVITGAIGGAIIDNKVGIMIRLSLYSGIKLCVWFMFCRIWRYWVRPIISCLFSVIYVYFFHILCSCFSIIYERLFYADVWFAPSRYI